MKNETFKIRDRREKGWFYLDNEYLNGYAKIFGPIGTAIYVSLCRYAGINTQSCWPSQKRIAKEVGITDRTVRKHIKKFEEWNIISVTRGQNENTKRKENNIYFLMDKSVWKKPAGLARRNYIPLEPKESGDGNRGNITTLGQRNHVPIKETQIKDTHKKEGFLENYLNGDRRYKPYFRGDLIVESPKGSKKLGIWRNGEFSEFFGDEYWKEVEWKQTHN